MVSRKSLLPSGLLLLGALLLSGCATPVGVSEVTPRQAYLAGNANPLGAGVLSNQAKYVLNRYDLLKAYQKTPAKAIATLHQKALLDDRRDILYALAETCYLHASQLAESDQTTEQGRAPGYFLLAALYSYYFALEERSEPPPSAFDQRARNSLDIYNFGLWQAFTASSGRAWLEPGEHPWQLPFGQITVSLDVSKFPWQMQDFDRFEPTDKYAVRGVSVLDRTPGVGLPLVGVRKKSGGKPALAVPVTAFLRVEGGLAALDAGTATASLELYSAQDSSTVQLEGHTLPLETDFTTPLAYQLEGAKIWSLGLSAFLGREGSTLPNGLYMHQPYRPGRIPVVFVHGTASSPVWWSEMINTLNFDPQIRQGFQFWYFLYSSSEPVVLSAANLRAALRTQVAGLDPQGEDAALQDMVVVGHSQGGLLTKLTVVDAGDRLLRSVTSLDIDAMKLSDPDKARVREYLMVKPLPFVKEVVFLSTPHRGSFRSKQWVRNLVRALVRLPATVVQGTGDLYSYMNDDVKKLMGGRNSVMTSADGQSPDNPLLKALADIPLAPGVSGHSIIAVKGGGDPKLGNDGVVTYASAHLEGMDSELVVRGGHSTQLNPIAIDEVRRILLEHLAAHPQAGQDLPATGTGPGAFTLPWSGTVQPGPRRPAPSPSAQGGQNP